MIGLCRVPPQNLDRTAHQSNNIHQVNDKEKSIQYIYMRRCSYQYKTRGKETSIRATLIYGLDSRLKTSTICISLRSQSRDTSHISGSIHYQQQPTRLMETSIVARIQAKNIITVKQSSLWLQWTKPQDIHITEGKFPYDVHSRQQICTNYVCI